MTDMSDAPIDQLLVPDQLMLIVVGASLRAELTDRELAYRMRERVLRWEDEHEQSHGIDPLTPVVCSDLWYMNDQPLLARPVISIGDPETNAASAFLGGRLPTAFVIDDTLRIHLDPEFHDVRASLWGVRHAATASAIDVFTERYFDAFLGAAHGLPTP